MDLQDVRSVHLYKRFAGVSGHGQETTCLMQGWITGPSIHGGGRQERVPQRIISESGRLGPFSLLISTPLVGYSWLSLLTTHSLGRKNSPLE